MKVETSIQGSSLLLQSPIKCPGSAPQVHGVVEYAVEERQRVCIGVLCRVDFGKGLFEDEDITAVANCFLQNRSISETSFDCVEGRLVYPNFRRRWRRTVMGVKTKA